MSDCTQLWLSFIHCRYKALLTRRRGPMETREYHQLAMRQRDSYHKKALSGLIASFDSANILVAPTSLSRSIRKHHRLVLKATCSLRGYLIGLPPIEAEHPDNGSSRSLTPILFSNGNMVREANKLLACVFTLLILDQAPDSVRRAKIVYGDGFDVRYVMLRGKNGATRLATDATAMSVNFDRDVVRKRNSGTTSPCFQRFPLKKSYIGRIRAYSLASSLPTRFSLSDIAVRTTHQGSTHRLFKLLLCKSRPCLSERRQLYATQRFRSILTSREFQTIANST